MQLLINKKSSMYVFSHTEHVTTRSFESLFKETNELAKRLGKPELGASDQLFGTPSVYKKHCALIEIARKKNLGMWFHSDTPSSVRRILKRAFNNAQQLRVFYGNTMTGQDWLEEYDVMGFVGLSTGILKVPLLMKPGAFNGGALLDHCLVKIVDVKTGGCLYKHHNYHRDVFTVIECDQHDFEAAILVDKKIHARFKTMDDAYHWMAFMVGKSFLLTK